MAEEHRKYMVTVDAATGATIKIEELGEGGELTEVPLGSACWPSTAGGDSYTVNIFMGGGGAPMSYTTTEPQSLTPAGFPMGPQGFPMGPQGFPMGPQGFPMGPQGFPMGGPRPPGFPMGPRSASDEPDPGSEEE